MILVAYGIRVDGKREIIDFMVTKHESEQRWESFLNRLYNRGLTGEVRRRTRPMSCFNNVQSIERIVYAVLSHLNDKWRIKPLKEFTQKS